VKINSSKSIDLKYEGDIYFGPGSNSYGVMVRGEFEIIIPITLPGHVPIALSEEGILSSFEFVHLTSVDLRADFLSTNDLNCIRESPIFDVKNYSNEIFDWRFAIQNQTFQIFFNRLEPDSFFEVDNVRFFSSEMTLHAIEVRNCQISRSE
jgi:hypothetical protein